MKPLGFFFVSLLLNIVCIESKSLNAVSAPRSDYNPRRYRRYLGLNRKYKLNKRYQECMAPGDIQGHCKHAIFCPINVLEASKNRIDSLCVIEKEHIGVCCPDDIASSKIQGSQVIMDLPASGLDYTDTDNSTGCGLGTMANDGPNSPVQRWPWIAALYMEDSPYIQFCGGALITDKHVLTAAHCLFGLRAKDIRVRLGEYDFLKLKETRSTDFSVKLMVMHEDYNFHNYENDIAMVTLDRSTNFNSYIWPICLPPIDESFENKTVFVAGWGMISYPEGPLSELLLEVSMPVWNQQKCIDSLAITISDNFICAAGYEGNRDSCKGDSGGPLLYQLENGRWVTIGIVSWGIGCGTKGKPGLYTRLTNYIPWVIENTLNQ